MKKIFSMLLIVLFAFILIACNETVHTVTFDSDGGTVVESKKVEDGKLVAEPTDPTRDGFTFVEWQLNGEKFLFTTPITADITLKAFWEEEEVVIDFSKTFKVLSIGNSFSEDSQRYLWEIAASYGIPEDEIIIANLYIGGSSLGQHYTNLRLDNASYTLQKFTSPYRVNTNNVTLDEGIMQENWDVITFQQASHDSGMPTTYSTHLDNLVAWAKEKQPDALIGWHMTWAYEQTSNHDGFANYNGDQLTMYQAIIDTLHEKVLSNEDIDIVIPAGTAIQNARTSFLGDRLTRDGYHLSDPMGRFIGGLSYFGAITGFEVSNEKIEFLPLGIDEDYGAVAFESVQNAILENYEITNSKLTEVPPIKVEGTLLEFEYQVGYWNVGSTGLFTPENSNIGNETSFLAVMPIAMEDFKLGSMVTIEEGYSVRIIRLSKNGDKYSVVSRTDNYSVRTLVIDYSIILDSEYIAFNISGGGSVVGREEEVANALKLYVTDNPHLPPAGVYISPTQWESTFRNLGFVVAWLQEHDVTSGQLKSLIEHAMDEAMDKAIADGIIPEGFDFGSVSDFSAWEGFMKLEYRDGDNTANHWGRPHLMLAVTEASLKADGTVEVFIVVNELFTSWFNAGNNSVLGWAVSSPFIVDGIKYQNYKNGYVSGENQFELGKHMLDDGTTIDLELE